MEDTYISPEDVVYALSSNNDASRKMGVFKLQSCIGDPSFAELFILHGGLEALKELVLNTTGNTLAYSLSSYSKLLEVDKGWESVDQPLLERVSAALLYMRESVLKRHRLVNLNETTHVVDCWSRCDKPPGDHPTRRHVDPCHDFIARPVLRRS